MELFNEKFGIFVSQKDHFVATYDASCMISTNSLIFNWPLSNLNKMVAPTEFMKSLLEIYKLYEL
jgi:hypothetical protein